MQIALSPKYNSYAVSIYNTLNYKGFNWYVETAFKSNDVFFNPRAEKREFGGGTLPLANSVQIGFCALHQPELRPASWALHSKQKGLQNFNFRIDPNLRLLRDWIGYIPRKEPTKRLSTNRQI